MIRSGISCVLILLLIIFPNCVKSCTIFCSKDKHGHVWAGNNEDFYWFEFNTRITVVPKTDSTLSFFFFSYNNHLFPQGGMNQAGLFFDANAVEFSNLPNDDRKPFPGGTQALVFHLLGHCKTVPEAIALFNRYSVQELNAGQIHLADRMGNMGIITADCARLTSGNFQISTNYNLCHKDDDYKNCWRYPIANALLKDADPDLSLMTRVCDSTRQRRGAYTIYSSIFNLHTGDLWFYYAQDYTNFRHISYDALTALNDTTFMMRDLFPDHLAVKAYNTFLASGLDDALKIINNFPDEKKRKANHAFLCQGILFDWNGFLTSEKVSLLNDDRLVERVIGICESTDVLEMLIQYNFSENVNTLAEKRLNSLRKAERVTYLLLLLVAAAILLFSAIVMRRWVRRRSAAARIQN